MLLELKIKNLAIIESVEANFGPGLNVITGETGAGKSMALVHLGAQAVLEGKTVVHYTLELADTVVATRYDSCITGIPLTHPTANLYDYSQDSVVFTCTESHDKIR